MYMIFTAGGKIYDSLQTTDWNNASRVLSTTAAVLAGAILAFNMEVMEFVVVTYTSSLTLSITGVVKVSRSQAHTRVLFRVSLLFR